MAEEEEEEVKIDDFFTRVSKEGFSVDDITPFLPSVDYKFTDEGELDGYEVKFNQGYYFNRTSETQVQTRDNQKISNMGDPVELPVEHDIDYYVEVIVNAENFLVSSATFTGVSGEGDDLTTQFPHILFEGDIATEFTGYFPILKLVNGSLQEYTQRSNIQLSDRQFKQLGGSAAGVSARPLVEEGHTLEGNPVRVRNIVAGTGITIDETASSIIINATGTGEGGGTGSCINIGSAVEVYNEGPPKSSNPFEFRSLRGKGTVDVLLNPDNNDEILISGSSGDGGSCANTGDGVDIYVEGSSNPFIFRSLQKEVPSNKNNVTVKFLGDNNEEILISGGHVDNIGAGAQVYYQDSIRPFEFKTLTGAENITITDQGNTLEIKSEDQNCGSAAWQAYVDGTKNPAKFRGLNFGDGIIVTADDCAPTISIDTGCCDLDDTLSVGNTSSRTVGVGGGSIGSNYHELTPADDNLHVEGKMGVGVSPSEITSYSDKVVICGSMRVKGGAGSIPTEGDFYLGTALTPALKKRISFGRGILEIGTDIQELDFRYPQAVSINPQGATSISHQSDLGGYDINYQSPATGSAILGGSGNAISGNYNVIIAGIRNQISGGNTNVIGGGSGINVDSSEFSVSVGGRNNDVSGSNFAVIGGGFNNLITGSDRASIAGGSANTISGAFAASIGGGQGNSVADKASVIAGGESNTIKQQLINGGYNFIGAGVSHTISGGQNTIAGGNNNIISGSRSITLGGTQQVIGADDAVTAGNNSIVQPSHDGAFVFSDSVATNTFSSGANTMVLSFKSGVFVETDSGIYINGNPVLTGETPEGDTLQSVTARGDTTTTNIISEKIVSGVTGAFGDVLAKGAFGIHGWQGDPDTHMKGFGDRIVFTAGGLTFADFSEGTQDLIHFNGNENQDIDFRVGYNGGASIFSRGSDGNVGVGTTNPSTKFHLGGGIARFQNAGSNYIEVDGSVAGANIARISSRFNRFEIVTNAGAGDPDISLMPAAGGNVGIGNNAPAEALSISTAAEAKDNNIDFLVANSYNAGLLFRDPAGGRGSIISNTDNDLIFSTNGTGISAETMRIDSAGNVGIGTTDPDDALTIVGTSADFSVRKADNGLAARIAQFSAGGAQLRLYDSGSNETIRLAGDGSNSFITGNVGIGTVSPSSALEVRGGNIDIGTNDIEGAANCKIEMDAADGFTLTNPNNAHGIDIVADDLTFFGGGIGNRKITTNAGDLSIDPVADLLLNENGGNVGVGTDSPQADLHVSGSGIFGIIGSNTPNSTVTVAGYDDFGLDFRAHGTWTHWKARVGHGKNFELYNDGTVNQKQVLELGDTTKDNASVYIRSTGAFIEAGMNASTSIPVVSMGCLADSDHLGGAYLDVRDAVASTHRYEFNRDGTFVASGVNVSGDVGGTGDGGRITLNGTGYLLVGEAAEADTLQTVTNRGDTTTTNIISEKIVSGITGTFNKELNVGDLGSDSHAFNVQKGDGLYDTNVVLKPFGNPAGFNSAYWMTISKHAYSGFITNGVYTDFYIGHDLNKTALKLKYDGGGVSTFTTSNTDINFENGTLFVDESAQKVGVGTTGPNVAFEIKGSVGTELFGINTTTHGNFRMAPATADSRTAMKISSDNSSLDLKFISSSERIYFGGEGDSQKVGINTVNPAEALEVVGNIELLNSTTGVDLGTLNNADGKQSVALGYDNDALETQSVAVGYGNQSTGVQSATFGNGNKAAVEGTAIGVGNHATASRGTALGRSNSAAQESTAIGYNSSVAGIRSIGIGRNVTASAQSSIAIGDTAKATGSNSVSIGLSSEADAYRSTAVGYNNTVDAVALQSSAFGYDNQVSKSNAGAFGFEVLTSGEKSFGLGYYTTIGVGNVTELGQYDTDRTRSAAVRINGSSSTRVPVAMTMHSGTNAPSASSAADGYEDAFSLGSDMYSIQRNGADYVLYHNLGGSIETTTLGASEADTLQSVTDRGNVTTGSVRVEGQLQVGPNDQSSNGELLIRGKEANIILRGLEGSDKAHTIREDGGTLAFSANTTLSGTDGINRFNIQTGKSFFTERFGVEGNGVEPKFYLASVAGGAHNKATYLYNPTNSADFRIALDGSHANSTGDIGTDAFTIKSSTHNVGIGTTDPDFKLEVVADDSVGVMAVRNGANARDTFRSENAAGTRTFNIGNDANGHGLVLVRGAGGTTTSQIAGNGDTFFDTDTLYIDHSANTVGIGTTNPLGKLHVRSANAGSFTYDTNADDLIVESNANGGITVATAAANTSRVIFASPDDATGGEISFNQTAKLMKIGPTTADGLLALQSANGVETMRLDASNNVGIGTTSPSDTLTINNDNNLLLGLDAPAGNDAQLRFYSAGNYKSLIYRPASSDDLRFNTATSGDVLTIKQNGNVGIGTTGPTAKLTVATTMASSPTSQLYLDVDGSNTVGGGGEVIFNTSASGGTLTNYNAIVRGQRSSLNDGSSDLLFLTTHQSTTPTSAVRMIVKDSGNVGIGATEPSVGLQLGNSTSGQTKTAIFNSEGGAEVGLTIKSRTNRAKLAVSDNDTTAYVVAEGTIASFGRADTAATTNISVLADGDVGIGTTGPQAKLHVIGHSKFNGTSYHSHFNYAVDGTEDTYIRGGKAGSKVRINDTHNSDVLIALGGGNVGIGTSPNQRLEVDGNIRLTDFSDTLQFGGTANKLSYNQWLASASGGMVIKNAASASTGHIAFETSLGEKLRILRDGNVGIGTTSPSAPLDISSSATGGTTIELDNTSTGGRNWTLYSSGSGNSFGAGKFALYDADAASVRMLIDTSGNVGIGTTSPSNALDVVGHFSATSKSFLIDHPTKENKKLQYASLEGPENGVYVRGTTDKETIELPEYWSELVHEDSITVVLTPIGKKQDLFIKEKSNKLIKIGGAEGSFDYVVYGERKDIDKLEIEPLKV